MRYADDGPSSNRPGMRYAATSSSSKTPFAPKYDKWGVMDLSMKTATTQTKKAATTQHPAEMSLVYKDTVYTARNSHPDVLFSNPLGKPPGGPDEQTMEAFKKFDGTLRFFNLDERSKTIAGTRAFIYSKIDRDGHVQGLKHTEA